LWRLKNNFSDTRRGGRDAAFLFFEKSRQDDLVKNGEKKHEPWDYIIKHDQKLFLVYSEPELSQIMIIESFLHAAELPGSKEAAFE
jgi:hypothetical protein